VSDIKLDDFFECIVSFSKLWGGQDDIVYTSDDDIIE
jgi:hypothetical protein